MIYALFPETDISIHAVRGLCKMNTVFAVGKSIFNRNIGELVPEYGGSHQAADTCEAGNDGAPRILEELVRRSTRMAERRE